MSRKTRKNRSQRSNCSIEPLENRQLMASDILLAAGDANSDGFFDASDFLQVFQRGKFLTAQQADWSQGDWNGDSQFDHSDLIVALQSGNYNNGPIAPNIQFDRSTEQLHIEGTLRSDAVEVSFFGDDFVAINLEIENDRPQSLVVRRTELAEIIFDGKAGNDHFVNRTDIRSISQGGEGDDVFTGGDANDSFAGGSGNDVLIGGKGVDVLFGNSGNDRIYGGLGGDLLDGGEGNDELYGEEDDDILIGGSDNDKFAGGPGSDFGVLGTSDTVDLENHTSLSSNSLVQQTSFAGFQLGESADAASEDEQNPLISTDPGLPCPSGNVCFDIPMFMLSQSDSRQGEDKEAKEPENVSGTLLIDPTRAYPIDFDFDPVGDIAIRGEDDDREMHITDVVQQRLGNCYFAAVLSSLTTTSFVLENKIRYVGQVDGGHEYAVKIFDVNVTDGGHITSVGEWTSVKLNYNKNANDNGYRRAEVLTDSENELWSVLYQLAYANKLQAENLNTNGGTAAAAFAAITGRTGMSLNVAESQYAIWWALNRGDIVYVGSPNSIGANGENQDLSNSTTDGGADRFHDGIVLNHGYSIVDLSGTGDEAVITLRNPWGNDNEYAKEMWSIMDQGTPNPNDGFISMSWGQFVRRFSIPKSSNVFIGLLQPRPSDAASSEYLTYGYLKQAALFSTGNTGEVIEDHVNWASRNWNEVEAKAAIVKHMQTIQDEGWRNLPDVYALVKNAVNMSQGNLADQHSIHRDWANSQHPGTVVDGIERELIKINDRYDLGLNVSNDRLQDHIVAAQVYGHLKQASKFAEGFRDEKIEDHTAWAMKYWAVAETRSGMVRHMENILNNGWQNLNEVFGHMKNAGLLANGKAIEPFAGHVHWANGQRVAVVGNGIEHHVNAIKNAFNLNLQSPIQAELPTERAMAEAFGHIKNAGLLSLSKGIENQQGHVSWALRQSQSAVAEAISGHMSNILRDGWRKLNRVYSYITNAQLVAEGKSAQPLPNLRNDAASKGAIALGDLIESRISSLRQIYGLDGGENVSLRIPGDLVDKVGKIGLDGWRGSPYNVDAVVRHPNGKAYFFRGDQYYRFDFSSDRRDKIGTIGSHGWKGVPTHLDAAILHPNGKAYFFKGSKYYRFNFKTEKVDKEGTIDVHGWKGVPRDVDATVMHPNGKAYFFKGNQYYRFDFRSDRVDKVSTIGSGGWSRLPANVDAAILHPNGKAYFFRGQQYHRFVF